MSTILLVDDDEMVQGVTTELLGMMGYSVLSAMDAAQALALASAGELQIDLVLLDLSLPDLSGNALIPRLVEKRPDLKIIICSGNVYEAESGGGRHPNVIGVLRKPFDLQTLRITLGEALPA